MLRSNTFGILLGIGCLLLGAPPGHSQEEPPPRADRGLQQKTASASAGYTLFAPLQSETTYLIDLDGEVVHSWTGEYRPGNSAFLRDNGNLVRCAREPKNSVFQGGGQGGRIQELTWDGELVWDFQYSDEHQMHHHDIELLPNGNVLLIAWERKSAAEAMAAGRDPESLTARELWPDKIVEVRPMPPNGAEVVWEWHVWDHLIQDFDEGRANHGDPAAHPELVDLNFAAGTAGPRPDAREPEDDEQSKRLRALGYLGGDRRRDRGVRGADWMHTNAIDYNPKLDQIAISVRRFHEIWILDHSTTTEEAAGHRGGKSGQGGDLLYRYGNPLAYRAGSKADQRFFGQHDVQWVPVGRPGAGRLMVFNNGEGRPDGSWSSIEEFGPALNSKGRYLRVAGRMAWGPEYSVWSYQAPEKESFYSGHISGAERLPNGNTLICDGEAGRFFEVSPKGKIVWDYLNPFGQAEGRPEREGPPGGDRPPRGGPPRGGPRNPVAVFRATRYSPDHPAMSRLENGGDDDR